MFPLFYYCYKAKNVDFAYKLKRVWAKIILFSSFLYPKIRYVKHKHKLPRPCIIISNHTSYIDIVLTPLYIDHTTVYLAKAELMKIPLFNYFFVYLDIPVNRKSIKDSHKAFLDAGKKIDQGYSVMLYPEGTISVNGQLKPFKNGAFKLAIEKQVPIVPAVNLNNWKFLQNGGFFKSNGSPGIPKVVVGEVIETKGMKEEDVEDLKKKVFKFVKEELDKYHGQQN